MTSKPQATLLLLSFAALGLCSVNAFAQAAALDTSSSWDGGLGAQPSGNLLDDGQAVFHQTPHSQRGPARIIGGKVAPDGRWPFQVSIQDASTGNTPKKRHYCGGVLISPTHVVSAAHCFDVSMGVKGLSVFVGSQNFEKGGRNIPVKALYSHPKFNEKTGSHDIAVLKLSKPVKGIAVAKLVPDVKTEQKLLPPGTKLYTTGWGNMNNTKPTFPSKLMEVDVPRVSAKACKAAGAVYAQRLDNTMLCAGYEQGGKDSCNADSGGGLYAAHKGKYAWVAGLVSWGPGECAMAKNPGVYARMAVLAPWVKKQMAKP